MLHDLQIETFQAAAEAFVQGSRSVSFHVLQTDSSPVTGVPVCSSTVR